MKLSPYDVKEFKLILKNKKLNLELFEIDNSEFINYDIYNIPISKGQLALRNFININYRIRKNPWCDMSNEIDRNKFNYGFLKRSSIWFWNWYNSKNINNILAIQNDNIVAIRGVPLLTNNVSNELCDLKNKLWTSFEDNQEYFGIPIILNKDLVEYNINNNTVIKIIRKHNLDFSDKNKVLQIIKKVKNNKYEFYT